MSGLKELWGLGDPASLDPQILQRFETEIQTFSDAIDRLNVSLQYTAANAPASRHDPLAQRRDTLLGQYQQALRAGKNAEKALKIILNLVQALLTEASQLAESTRVLKQRWEQQSSTLVALEELIVQDESNGDVKQTRQALAKIAEASKLRDYQTACDLLASVGGMSATSAGPGNVPGGAERRYPLAGRLPDDPVVPTDRVALAGWSNPMVNGDPRELFTADRMDEVVDMHFSGEGTPELNNAMRSVLFAQPDEDVSKHLAEIGRMRGLEPGVVKAQFERFQQLQGVSQQLETTRGLPPDDAMTTRREEYLKTRGDFLGTQSSLRFGQVVGEATGLDPAFAAMLNPTGGMVGPGMDVLAPTDADSPIIWHGIFHDAGGYLLNYQNSGPGYTYLPDKQPESGRRGSDPVQGQVEGISYWYERMQPERSVFEDLYEFDSTAADPAKKELMYDRYVRHPIADAELLAGRLSENSVNEVHELTSNTRNFSRESVASLKNSTRDAADAVQAQIGEADQTLDEMAAKAREVGISDEMVAAAQAAIKAELQNASSQVEVWEQGVTAVFDTAGAVADDNLDAVDRWADEAGATVRQQASEMARELEDSIHRDLVELAQDRDLQDALHRTANFYGETKQDVEALVDRTSGQIDAAKAKVNEFYDSAIGTIDQGRERATQEFTNVKNDLIDKLSSVQDTAGQAVDDVERQIDRVAGDLSESGQNILDAAAGIADSLADTVAGGTDTLAHSLGSATDFAADRLDRLTNLLG